MDLRQVLEKTLAMMLERPRGLAASLDMVSSFEELPAGGFSVAHVLRALKGQTEEDNGVALAFGRCLWQWDYSDNPVWAEGTKPQTDDRRQLVYRLLGLGGEDAETVTKRLPIMLADRPTVIAEEHQLWYPPKSLSQFYWNAYIKYLREKNGWKEDSINSMHESTTAIIQRLSDPTAEAVYQSKGLVVGYVQSGKTANFTGLIAKAADAGYRLFIVLGGLLDILRNQTQRRIDKELIGKELLRKSGGHEYQNDSEWDAFTAHGALPSELGYFDWQRLTGQEDDFKSLARGIEALEFERIDPRAPFFSPQNLHRAKARLIVIKKNTSRINKLIGDLRALRSKLADVPALVIDDESDQASVNTRKPTQNNTERSKTNQAITELLQVLPRAQYVGYTATPFANVFIDPDDAVDLFPKDFLISLPRPIGYMGVDSFYDLTPQNYEPPDPRSNQGAFVRDIKGEDEAPENLQRAVDSFVLAGAIKLFRQKRQPDLEKRYRHHTMLIHQSAFTERHDVMADLVQKKVVDKGGYFDGSGFKRLAALWEKDFMPVSEARGEGLPSPRKFEDLKPLIGPCLLKCARTDNLERQVRIVNGQNRDDTPDFDESPVWGILVGGTKLSRGYTIEGLTISYYRRATSTADTLMQMGRWFGYRRGYQDLVRLFIGRHEPLDKKGNRHLDLYEAFEAICLDEMTFRRELERYASLEPRVLPKQIPPLVTVHRPDILRPSATNKMYNAELKYLDFGGEWSEPTLAPTEDDTAGVNHNIAAMRALLNTSEDIHDATLAGRIESLDVEFPAIVATVSPDAVVTFLESYAWAKDPLGNRRRSVSAQLGFLRSGVDVCIDRWLLVAPQAEKDTVGTWAHGEHTFIKRQRGRVEVGDGARYKAYSEPQHRGLARVLCGASTDDVPTNRETKDLVSTRQGVLVFYPVRDKNNESKDMTSIGFGLQFPGNKSDQKVRFGVKDPTRPDEVVVQVPSGGAGSRQRRS